LQKSHRISIMSYDPASNTLETGFWSGSPA
jgi:hypothetical protein